MSGDESAAIELAPPKPFGIGGGLALLALFFIWQPLFFLSSVRQENNAFLKIIDYVPKHIAKDIAVFYYLELAHLAIAASLLYIAGLTLLNGLKKGRKIALTTMFSVVLLDMSPFFFTRLLPDEVRTAVHGAVMGNTAKAIVFSIIWGLYLNFSRRCKNTYDTAYPIPPAKSWLWTACKVIFGGILALGLMTAAHGAGRMRNATTGNFQTIPTHSVPADKISFTGNSDEMKLQIRDES